MWNKTVFLINYDEPNISPWRRAVCGDLMSAFDFGTAVPAFPTLPTPVAVEGPRGTYRTPPSTQKFPAQEPGVRPTRALPYALAANGRATSGGFVIDFVNTGTAGAHFGVYADRFRTDGPWRYTVEAGKTLSDTWVAGTPTGAYDLTAYGPNGFLRRFAGHMETGRPGISDPTMASGALPCTVAFVDSQEVSGANGAGTNAVDGDTATIWHTKWTGTAAPLPHEIQLDLGFARTVTGLRYVPRTDGPNGRVGSWELYLGADGTNWGSRVAAGVFADDATPKDVRCAPSQARYVRLVALTEAGGRGPWTSAAEVVPLDW